MSEARIYRPKKPVNYVVVKVFKDGSKDSRFFTTRLEAQWFLDSCRNDITDREIVEEYYIAGVIREHKRITT